jgi:phosphatidylglycerol lysyltransferase
VFFDPLYRAGRLFGYVAVSKRRLADATAYAEQAIMKQAIETFQREGLQELRLGLCPFADVEDRDFRHSRLVHYLFRKAFSSRLVNERFYNVQGHADYKRRYYGREEKIYYATGRGSNFLRLLALAKVCKLV